MSTPNSGTTIPDLTTNIGDVSKLDFLKNVPLDDTPAPSPEVPAPAGDTGREPEVPAGSTEAEDTAASDIEPAPALGILPETTAPAPAPATETPAPAASRNPDGTVSARRGVRDYSDIAPEDVDYFKQMSDKAYAQAKSWYLAHKQNANIEDKYKSELTELREYKYYQHPEAYKLSPDYQKASSEANVQAAIVNHWTQQLAKLDANEPINDIGTDEKGNRFIKAEPIPPNPALRAQVTAALQRAIQAQATASSQLESLSSKYTERSKTFDEQFDLGVNTLVQPELLKHPAFVKYHDAFLHKVIPPHLQNVPVYRQAAKMAAFISVASQQIAALQKALQTRTVQAAAVRQQGPGDGQPATGSGDWMDQPIDAALNQLNKARAAYQ